MGSGKKGLTGEDGSDSRNTIVTEEDWRAACKKSVTNVNELSQEISLKPSEASVAESESSWPSAPRLALSSLYFTKVFLMASTCSGGKASSITACDSG